jgi:TRAP-type C4-dicarboxylate transport system permease small subunit
VNTFIKNIEKISQLATWISGTVVLLTAILIAVEVVLRKVFVVSMGGADELSTYALAICCSWSFGFALFRKAHIRIDLLYVRFPNAVRHSLDIISLLFLAIYTILLSYFGFIVFHTSWIRESIANTPLATPLWIPQGLWLLGILLFTLCILSLFAGTVYHLLRSDFSQARKLSGAPVGEIDMKEKE